MISHSPQRLNHPRDSISLIGTLAGHAFPQMSAFGVIFSFLFQSIHLTFTLFAAMDEETPANPHEWVGPSFADAKFESLRQDGRLQSEVDIRKCDSRNTEILKMSDNSNNIFTTYSNYSSHVVQHIYGNS